jgi:hypothetical protein
VERDDKMFIEDVMRFLDNVLRTSSTARRRDGAAVYAPSASARSASA